jgi:hypothetical protein
MPVERFLYLMNLSVLVDVNIGHCGEKSWFSGKFEGIVDVNSAWFNKGEYEL